MTAKTIDASPRGPNQPEEGDRRRPCVRSEQRERDGEHANDGQADHRVQRDLPRQVVQSGAEDDRAEDEEGDGVQELPALVDQVADLGFGPAPHSRRTRSRRRRLR